MMNKLKNTSVLLFAGGQYRPYPFAPVQADGFAHLVIPNPPKAG
jgi:hypothetical protein